MRNSRCWGPSVLRTDNRLMNSGALKSTEDFFFANYLYVIRARSRSEAQNTVARKQPSRPPRGLRRAIGRALP